MCQPAVYLDGGAKDMAMDMSAQVDLTVQDLTTPPG
jgi:hypothetical protein